ncbi:MAG: hypothetical protein QT03_C0001G1078 [archaeon GW2011_AR10]|uniref:tRNA (cytidine(56)-2'-O)-methyltransferase n=1 Tax=Candidatus Iainarchaeum sp. TaxID=3101447 RepID=A0A7J4IU66_9ARCH|nr:MAG: hypothetical protein QT03_C0001G1078 [archaeon GW2011_AR10]HIH07899.1 tRNA (cytidine(56)-2'-O)-methyltransferase [Candidatus Diapherotrites archaeon]
MGKDVVVLRYGHRHVRDYRVTSHCCLVARAFGAEKIVIHGEKDDSIEKTIEGIKRHWGGAFSVEFTESWKKTVEEHKKQGFYVVHATMYGIPIEKEISRIRKKNKVLFVIGSQKVEALVYKEADLNIAITQQPHSEIAALAVFLDRYFEGKELGKVFRNAKYLIEPSANGKKISRKA